MISSAQTDFYLENGYLRVENILSAEKLAKTGDALEKRYELGEAGRAQKAR